MLHCLVLLLLGQDNQHIASTDQACLAVSTVAKSAWPFVQGERLERIWSKLKTTWNQFHSIMDGFVNFECQEGSAFGRLSDETPAAIFLGFQNQDNECVKVLQALITLQV